MAILSPPPATAANVATYRRPISFLKFNPLNFISRSSIPFPINPNSYFLPPCSNPIARFRHLHAALSPPPQPQPPPQPGPPPEKDPIQSKGIVAIFSRFRDRIQIFLAVFFWMSLFFWASAWDGRNGGGGRPSKGSRFRR